MSQGGGSSQAGGGGGTGQAKSREGGNKVTDIEGKLQSRVYGITEDISSTIRLMITSDLNMHLSDKMNKLLSNVVIGRHLMVFRLSITRVFLVVWRVFSPARATPHE